MVASLAVPPSLAFHPNEAVEKGLVRILERLAGCTAEIVPHSPRKLSDSVHNTRVLIKRLRALLWFARPAFSSSEMTQAKSSLQKASHLLAAQRDLVVTRSILQMLSRKTPDLTYRKALIRLSRNLNGTATIHGKTIQTLGQVAGILHKTIKEIEAHVKIHSQWPATSDRMAQAFHATKKVGKRALKHDDPAQFHAWRKKAKRLLYLLQLTWTAPSRRTIRLLERVEELQEKLGDYHDSVVVQDHLQKKAPDKATPLLVRHSVNLLEKRKRHLREDVRKIAKHINSLINRFKGYRSMHTMADTDPRL
jgi:CHAD domain-containing protein